MRVGQKASCTHPVTGHKVMVRIAHWSGDPFRMALSVVEGEGENWEHVGPGYPDGWVLHQPHAKGRIEAYGRVYTEGMAD